MKRKMISLGIGMCILLGLVGCSQVSEIKLQEEKEQVDISFSWWGKDNRHQYTMEAIREFEQMYPHIRVQLQYSEWSGFENRMDVKIASRTGADIMQINYNWLTKYSPDGKGFYDLNTLGENIDLSAFEASELKYGEVNGILNGVPIALNAKVFYYNEDVYNSFGLEVPKTWEDLYRAAEVMNPKGVYPLEFDYSTGWFVLVAYAEQKQGKAFVDANGKLLFNEEDLEVMIEGYMELVENNVIERFENRDGAAFENGMYAGTVQWITGAERYEKMITSKGQNFVIGEFPVLEGAVQNGWYAKPAALYVMSQYTNYPQESALLLNFLVNGEEMMKRQQVEKGVPVSKIGQSFLTEEIISGIQYASTQAISNHVEVASTFLEDSSVQNIFKEALEQAMYGGVSVEEAASVAYNEMKQVMR
jgi:oligogalacturonide transport system substrate-binding protein